MFKAIKIESTAQRFELLGGVPSIRGVGKVVPCMTTPHYVLHWRMEEGTKMANQVMMTDTVAVIVDAQGRDSSIFNSNYQDVSAYRARGHDSSIYITNHQGVAAYRRWKYDRPAIAPHMFYGSAIQTILAKYSSHPNITVDSGIRHGGVAIFAALHIGRSHNVPLELLRDGFKYGIHPMLKQIWTVHEERVKAEKKNALQLSTGAHLRSGALRLSPVARSMHLSALLAGVLSGKDDLSDSDLLWQHYIEHTKHQRQLDDVAFCEGGYGRHVQQQFDRAALADLTGLSVPTTN